MIDEALLAPHGFTRERVEDPLPAERAHLTPNPMGAESALLVLRKQV